MTTLIGHWIAGEDRTGSSGRTLPVRNPASGEHIADVGLADDADLEAAVAAAKAALPGWRATSLGARAQIMLNFREVLRDNADHLAEILTREHGKVLADARGEVARGMESVEYAAGIPQLLKGEYSQQVSSGVDIHSVRQPVGVVAGITPFNFPVMVPLWMSANAVACGNTVVIKPSERDPSATVELARLWKQAGLPDGVFNVLQGDRTTVEGLIDHPEVAAVSFVGSTPIARSVYERATGNGKRAQALGGAKNHMMVLPDADIEMAADAAVAASCEAAGERCMSVSVLLAVGEVADPLIEAIRERMTRLNVGNGAHDGTDVGPLITSEHRQRVTGYIEAGEDAGAKVLLDGRTGPHPEGGFFVGPTLLDHVTPEMTVYTDEIFGPVLSVVRCATYEEGLQLINDHEFGNGAAIFTRDGGVARQFEFDVNIGMVGINVSIPVPVAYYSFGGWKSSLFGDAHMYGPDSINFFTRGKVVTSRWPQPASR